MRDRYLQLPPEITARTRQLAAEITADGLTPYDKAEAITEWLRRNIHYNDQRPAPPSGVEPVDDLLFTSKEGYCNYYASAEVVMLRSLGIPARLAVGFAQGEFAADRGVYRVRETDAHAWPQVYFPGYGWVEFEPTVAQSPLQRLPGDPLATPIAPDTALDGITDSEARDNLPPEELQDPAAAPTDPFWPTLARRAAIGSAGVLGALVLALLAWWWLEYRGLHVSPREMVILMATGRSRRKPGDSPPDASSPPGHLPAGLSLVALAYGRLLRALRWLGIASRPSATPFERAAALETALPGSAEPVRAIAGEYVKEMYSGRNGDGQTAASAWSALRLGVWLAAIKRRFGAT